MERRDWEDGITLRDIVEADVSGFNKMGIPPSSLMDGNSSLIKNISNNLAKKIMSVIKTRGKLMQTCIFIPRNGCKTSPVYNVTPLDIMRRPSTFGIKDDKLIDMPISLLNRMIRSKYHIFRSRCPDCNESVSHIETISSGYMGNSTFIHHGNYSLSAELSLLMSISLDEMAVQNMGEPECKYVKVSKDNGGGGRNVYIATRDLPIWNPTWRIKR